MQLRAVGGDEGGGRRQELARWELSRRRITVLPEADGGGCWRLTTVVAGRSRSWKLLPVEVLATLGGEGLTQSMMEKEG